jgi:hypothetical protein
MFEDLHRPRNRRIRFQPLVVETSGYVHPAFQKTLADWEALARKRLGPERLSSTNKGFSTRRRVSSIVNRWNAVSTIRRLGDALSLHLSTLIL